ncbi:MAG: hypothetical protein GY816_11095 [Cytophagales bacterium]|nr:hypothetical protein [Cytophagales bacterium]
MEEGVYKSENTQDWLHSLDKIKDKTSQNYFSRLPQEDTLLEYFSEAFVINKPKGRVGSDGFWFHSNQDDAYLALFTCIGEGHLANMMIRIYMNALKKMVDEHSIDFTGSILQFLHAEVQAKFKNKANILLNTNANIGIVKLNTQSKEMEFAGANMDLFQITGDKAQIIEGEKHQVGETGDKKLAYSSITLENPDKSSFYLCSSGVLNLIGGKDYKKLTSQRLSKLFRTNSGHLMDQQKVIADDFLTDWTGANRQNDDIMVIGFRA